MPRVYANKGEQKLSVIVPVPLTRASVDTLKRQARERNITRTELARLYILTGLVGS